MSPQQVFAITAALPLAVALIALQLDEKRVPRLAATSSPLGEFVRLTSSQGALLWQTLRQRQVWLPTLFVFLWHATPSCGDAFFYFLTEDLLIGPEFLGRVQALRPPRAAPPPPTPAHPRPPPPTPAHPRPPPRGRLARRSPRSSASGSTAPTCRRSRSRRARCDERGLADANASSWGIELVIPLGDAALDHRRFRPARPLCSGPQKRDPLRRRPRGGLV